MLHDAQGRAQHGLAARVLSHGRIHTLARGHHKRRPAMLAQKIGG
jgi:hypothetical protein